MAAPIVPLRTFHGLLYLEGPGGAAI